MPTPQFTIKVGSDSSLFFSRENTTSDGFEAESSAIGKIKDRDGSNGCDNYEYPVLVRRTGDSIKGTTETIESNELRKGRTKSAPRQGSSSSEGNLDYEFSPETYDDIMEATLRGEWKEWKSDKNSSINLEDDSCEDGYFFTKAGNLLDKNKSAVEIDKRSGKATRKLLGSRKEYNEAVKAVMAAHPELSERDAAKDPSVPLVVTDAEEMEIHELTCGTKDIKYSILKHFGGVKDDDLYQEFEHMAVNSISLEVTPGQIVTGSFSFMGANNPDLVQKGVRKFEEATEYADDDCYFSYDSKSGEFTSIKVGDADEFAAKLERLSEATVESEKKIYREVRSSGLIGKLAKVEGREGRFSSEKTPAEVQAWIESLPEKGTSTDQYTARQGFLYVNGERVQYGSTLSMELNNGLSKTYAIFEKDSIATSPLELDITGTLGVYLIKDYAEKLYNLASQDKDVELLFCFQDKENDDEDSEALYLMQIFKSKFTDKDLSSGKENLEVSFPFQSFGEQALRIFRIRKRKPVIYDFDPLLERGADLGYCKMSSVLESDSESTLQDKLSATLNIDGKDIPVVLDVDQSLDGFFRIHFGTGQDGTVPSIKRTNTEQLATLTVKYNDDVVATKSVRIGAAELEDEEAVRYEYTEASSYEDDIRYYQRNIDGSYSEVSDIAEDRALADNFTLDGTADGPKFYTRTKAGETEKEKLFSAHTTEIPLVKLKIDGISTVNSSAPEVATAEANDNMTGIIISSVAKGNAVVTVAGADGLSVDVAVTVDRYGSVSYEIGKAVSTAPEFTAASSVITLADLAGLADIDSVTSGENEIVTAETEGSGTEKVIRLVSVSAGTATVTVSDSTGATLELNVTVADSGAISYEPGILTPSAPVFTASSVQVEASDLDQLTDITSAVSDDDEIATAAITGGTVEITSVGAGTTAVTVSDGTNSVVLDVVVSETGTIAYTVRA